MSDIAESTPPTHVWIFHSAKASFASGVFTHRDQGLAWIAKHRLTGILTKYPVGDGCYDIAVQAGHFTPSQPHHGTSAHVATFSPSYTDHVHVRTARSTITMGKNEPGDRNPPHSA